jgi:hypothetical protein
MEANDILLHVKKSYALHEFVQITRITRTSYLNSGFIFMTTAHEILMLEDVDDAITNS